MLADRIESIDTSGGFNQQTVLADAASVLQAGTIRNGKPDATRESPLSKVVLAEAKREGIIVPDSPPVDSAYLPITSTVNGESVTLSGNGSNLAVSIDGKPAGVFTTHIGSELHGNAYVNDPVIRRVVSVLFNIYGTFLLVGGALYSAYIFLRKRIMPNRVMGNVLIAAGALLPATGGLLNRFGLGGYLYVGELVGAILMFGGFLLATRRPEEETVAQAQAVAAPSGD